MKRTTRWGILGTGNIARQFAAGLRFSPGAKLIAVGSRSMETARRFAREFAVPHCHGTYADLAADEEVDVVYVSSPHSQHKENMLLCLKAGKAVLCEKPFTINAKEAREAVALARRKKLFLMEAMWTRYLPPIVKLRELLAKGTVGEVRMVSADFGFRAERDPKGRLFDPRLGGGSLLDIGVYPISLAMMILGIPTEVIGLAHLGPTGVDEQMAAILGFEGGKLASLCSTIRSDTPNEATIIGETGHVRLHPRWWKGAHMTVTAGRKSWKIDERVKGNGYNYEADEVARCLREGKLESPGMPLDETLAVMRTMDTLRAQWGLRYPMEPAKRAKR